MKRLLALTTTVSLSAGVFGVAGAAQAAVFTVGSTLNIGTSVQFNGQISQSVWNTFIGGPYPFATLNGTTDVYNGADNVIIANGGFPVNPDPGTVGFAPTIPNNDSSIDTGNPGNYILDAQTPPPGLGGLNPNPQDGNVIDIEAGDIGLYATTQQGTGTWSPINPFLQGRIRSYDSTSIPNGLDANTAFINLNDGAGINHFFSLDSFSFTNVGSNAFQFLGFGRVQDAVTGEIANVQYNYTTQELIQLINAANGLPFNVTNASSLSLTITVIASVPEPTGISGLIAATTLGLLALRKKASINTRL